MQGSYLVHKVLNIYSLVTPVLISGLFFPFIVTCFIYANMNNIYVRFKRGKYSLILSSRNITEEALAVSTPLSLGRISVLVLCLALPSSAQGALFLIAFM